MWLRGNESMLSGVHAYVTELFPDEVYRFPKDSRQNILHRFKNKVFYVAQVWFPRFLVCVLEKPSWREGTFSSSTEKLHFLGLCASAFVIAPHPQYSTLYMTL